MGFFSTMALGVVAVAAFLVLSIRHFRRPRRLFDGPLATATTLGLSSFPVWCFALTRRLILDSSSTAVVAVYGVPFFAALLAAASFAVSWALATLVGLTRRESRDRRVIPRAFLASLVLASLVAWLLPALRQESRLQEAESPDSAPSQLAELSSRALEESDTAVLAAVAANPKTPTETLVKIVASSRPEWREAHVGRLRSWLLLPPRRASTVAAALASNPNLPRDAIDASAEGGEIEVIWRLAQNPATPPEQLTLLAGREEASIRSAVAFNRTTPQEVLARLAQDPEQRVRVVVAGNPQTPAAALEILARDSWLDIRVHVASNLNTPRPTLEALAQDPDEKVRRYAAQRLDASPNR